MLFNLPPDHSTLMALGLSNTNWLGTALPFALGPIGAPGCNLLVSLDATYPLFNWAGQATWSLPIPNQPSLAGMAFYNQAAAIDHGNALGLVFSNGGGILDGASVTGNINLYGGDSLTLKNGAGFTGTAIQTQLMVLF
jgi:hypothetical protein